MFSKIIGAIIGYMMGGFWGLVTGVVIGHYVGKFMPKLILLGLKRTIIKHQEKVQKTFFESTFMVMGYLAKIDGHVSEQEIQMARQVMRHMNLDEEATKEAMRLFGEGKSAEFDLDATMLKLRSIAIAHRNLAQMFIEIQLTAAYADGSLAQVERDVLLKVCVSLGFSEGDLDRIEARMRAERHGHQPGRTAGVSMEDAYGILELDESATDAEVKKAYRKLTSQHHPDKLQAKGLPKEMMKMAEEKTHEIRSAYERIREERGFK